MNKNKKVIVYVRANDQDKIGSQLADIKAYADKNNLEIDSVFCETTPNYPNYPAFNEMLDEIKNGEVETVLINDLSRLPRMATSRLIIANLLKTTGTELKSVTGDQDMLGVFSLYEAVLDFEKQLRCQSIKRGIENAKAKNQQ